MRPASLFYPILYHCLCYCSHSPSAAAASLWGSSSNQSDPEASWCSVSSSSPDAAHLEWPPLACSHRNNNNNKIVQNYVDKFILFIFQIVYVKYVNNSYAKQSKISELSNYCLNIFTARCVCIAQTMPWQDVCLSICLSVTRWYCA